MWPAYFANHQDTNILDPSYYSSSEALVAPTLVNKDFKIEDGIQSETLNSGYQLVEFPSGPTSLGLVGLASKLEIKQNDFKISRGKVFVFDVRVINIGQSIWLGGGLARGSVNIGTRIISKDGTLLNSEISRSTIVEFPNYVVPKTGHVVPVAIHIDEPGDYLIEVSPVAEGLAWFSGLNSTNAKLIRVKVQ